MQNASPRGEKLRAAVAIDLAKAEKGERVSVWFGSRGTPPAGIRGEIMRGGTLTCLTPMLSRCFILPFRT